MMTLCSIAPKHIEFHSDYLRIFVPHSKTDACKEGNYVSRSKYCPAGVLPAKVLRYIWY